MKTNAQFVDLPTYTVLVDSTGEILDIRTQHLTANVSTAKFKGRVYADECASRYRSAIKEVLNRKRQLLSAVMPPPILGTDAWFAVVGVPLGASRDSGALFVHVDISPWVMKSGAKAASADKISTDLLQRAMSTMLIDGEPEPAAELKSRYEGIESLTARQREVLQLVGTGKSNIEIAEVLSCSLNTVKRHVTAVLQKLRLPNRTRAAMLAHRLDHLPKD